MSSYARAYACMTITDQFRFRETPKLPFFLTPKGRWAVPPEIYIDPRY